MAEAFARFGGRLATDLKDVTDDAGALDVDGWWAIVLTYEGSLTAARFSNVRRADEWPTDLEAWRPIARESWLSSMSRDTYIDAVEKTRVAISEGTVYQTNICRMLSARREGRALGSLALLLEQQHHAPHGGAVILPEHDVEVASASPELFLQRDGDKLSSSPIKGTGRSADDLLDKDTAENVMIVDLVRNDLGRVSQIGSVSVPSLLRREEHPGLVHLVSTVSAQLARGVTWGDIFEATFPPGSVTGAPKSSACRLIEELEPTPRGAYCGAVGWIDATNRRAQLAVGIRTFWADADSIYFGTGAGITWGSDAGREWDETELKAERLLSVAAQQ